MTSPTTPEPSGPRHVERWLLASKITTIALMVAMIAGITFFWQHTISIEYPAHISARQPGQLAVLVTPAVAEKLHKGQQLLLAVATAEFPVIVQTIISDESGNEVRVQYGPVDAAAALILERHSTCTLIVSRRTVGDYIFGRGQSKLEQK